MLLLAARETGVDVIIPELSTRQAPLVWVKFDTYDPGDEVSQGSKLSDAVARALGSPLFGHGLPLHYGIEILHRVQETVGPFTLVVSNAQIEPAALSHFFRLAASGSRLLAVADTKSGLPVADFTSVSSGSDLLLTNDEARDFAPGLEEDKVMALLMDARRLYVPFQRRLRVALQLPPLVIPEPGGGILEPADEINVPHVDLVHAVAERGSYSDALEIAIRAGLDVSDELIAKAGQHFFDRGLHRRLFGLLLGLGRRGRQKSAEIMRWYFSAATAVNEHVAVRAEVQEYLSQHEAPELRALFAGAFTGGDLLEETARAVAACETPLTLRLHAFALGQVVGVEEAVTYLVKALRLAEALGQDATVMACATDLAGTWIKAGQYGDAVEWGRWSLEWHQAHALKDEIRRLMALSAWCFGRLLIGDVLGLDNHVQDLDISLAGIPTTESAVSTRGDWHFVQGSLAEAERCYRINVAKSHLGQFHYTAVDLVHCLVEMGREDEALQLGRRARVLTRRADPASRGLGDLALGMALARQDPTQALEQVKSAQGSVTEAPRIAQATIALAKIHLRHGREDAARRALEVGEHALKELAWTGWKLLGGFDPEVKALYDLFRGETNELEMHFLGGERLVFRGKALELGLRQCECLVVLASRPDGVTAERLGLDVYGETAHFSTLKAIVSRLRQVVPIESKPYRIAVPAWADFVELERLVASGRVREAMSLYRGPLLPRSQAPAVLEIREHLEEVIRQAVLSSGDVEALLQLAKVTEVDLELYEAALERMSRNDPRFPVVRARLEHVRRSWADA